MRHDFFSPQLEDTYKVAVLVGDLRMGEIKKEYVEPSGLPDTDFLVLSLHRYPGKKKTPAAEIKQYITEELAPVFQERDVKVLLVGDSDYFKVLTKQSKAEPYLGYAVDCAFGPWKVVYVPSYRTVFYDPPKIRQKIKMGLDAMTSTVQGTYQDPGEDIIRHAEYPRGEQEIFAFLQKLLDMDCDLASDIEAFSLKHYDAGIGSIAFAWNQHEGGAFLVDMTEDQTRGFNAPVREMLKAFFIELYERGHHVKWHNIGYDVYVLIYQLFMSDILDIDGLYEGMYYLLSDWDCTKLISYLATNSCAGNELGLKAQSREFAGNYAEDEIEDILKIPYQGLLLYNLKDTLSTWHTYDKHWPTVIADQQEDIYVNLFKPAMVDIIQMQLTGMPVNMSRVLEVKRILETDEEDAFNRIQGSDLVKEFVYDAQVAWVNKKNATLKKKRVTLADVGSNADFNPNSAPQLVALLYTRLKLPVLEVTETGQPSAGGEVLESLLNHTKDPKIVSLLQALIDWKAVNKLVTSFVPALLKAQQGPDGWHYLFGNFNLGGTVSGRLSSSNPNLQNLPAANGEPTDKKTIYGKLIKSCFEAPPGWLYCGLDFDSLEDRISALTTRDPNKLKVYTDGYDGHCLRAFYYFPERLPGIVDTRESINSIKKLFPDVRQDSKAPTFALTYQGTWSTLVKNCGFPIPVAQAIEQRYHEMYVVSDRWVQKQLDEATRKGYITAAFGLRIRTPMLHQVFLGTSKTPTAAAAEGRTAGNALGQSWCLLNNRAGSEFMGVVRSGIHWRDIRPCAHIHDAQYYLIRADPEVVAYANLHLVKAVRWQNHPLIYHDEVKLGGELSIFYPNWSKEIVLPNEAVSAEAIEEIVNAKLTA